MTALPQRVLEAGLVRLRPLAAADHADILRYAVAKEIAANTFVPRPYPPEAAAEFIRKTQDDRKNAVGFTFAVIEADSEDFAGCMGIHVNWDHKRADIGYWIGLPFWGRGLATAALRRLIQFGFDELRLNRIEAGHFVHNPASGRVMQKANMRYEGLRRGYCWHREAYKDLHWYAITQADYAADRVRHKVKT